MKKILLFLLCLLAAYFILDRVLYYFARKEVYDKVVSGGNGGQINYLLQRKRDIDFLVMGNSRARLHIDPARLTNLYNGNGFNAAIIAVGDVYYNHVLLDMVLRNGIKPKALILQVDASRFSRDDKAFELSALLNYIGSSDVLDRYVATFSYKDRLLLCSQLFRFNGKVFNLAYNYTKIGSVGNNDNGFAPQDKVMDIRYEVLAEKETHVKHPFLPEKVTALKQIYGLCRDNGIRLYMVTTPAFQNCTYNEADNNTLRQVVAEMPGVHLFQMDDIRKFPALAAYDNWCDVNHMNRKGAILFSTILNDSLAAYR